jgi:hypothetical protein
VAPADVGLGGFHGLDRGLAPLELDLVEPRLQHRHRVMAVLVLRALGAGERIDEAPVARGPKERVSKGRHRFCSAQMNNPVVSCRSTGIVLCRAPDRQRSKRWRAQRGLRPIG